jgi:hypothetical protein
MDDEEGATANNTDNDQIYLGCAIDEKPAA